MQSWNYSITTSDAFSFYMLVSLKGKIKHSTHKDILIWEADIKLITLDVWMSSLKLSAGKHVGEVLDKCWIATFITNVNKTAAVRGCKIIEETE